MVCLEWMVFVSYVPTCAGRTRPMSKDRSQGAGGTSHTSCPRRAGSEAKSTPGFVGHCYIFPTNPIVPSQVRWLETLLCRCHVRVQSLLGKVRLDPSKDCVPTPLECINPMLLHTCLFLECAIVCKWWPFLCGPEWKSYTNRHTNSLAGNRWSLTDWDLLIKHSGHLASLA